MTSCVYRKAGPLQRAVRWTAATRPLAWLYCRIQQPLDTLVYRLSRRRTTLSSWMAGVKLVMLTTTGARSGRRRTVPVLAIRDGDGVHRDRIQLRPAAQSGLVPQPAGRSAGVGRGRGQGRSGPGTRAHGRRARPLLPARRRHLPGLRPLRALGRGAASRSCGWSGAVTGWQLEGTAAEAYERYLVPAFFGPFADRLVELAAPRPADRALDVACGTGIVARRIAARVARAVGLDSNPGMLEVARTVEPSIEWRAAEAGAMPLPDASFDLVLCQQGLQFFPDRAAALREMRRVLAPGGRLAVSAWRAAEHNPGWLRLAEALDRHAGRRPARSCARRSRSAPTPCATWSAARASATSPSGSGSCRCGSRRQGPCCSGSRSRRRWPGRCRRLRTRRTRHSSTTSPPRYCPTPTTTASAFPMETHVVTGSLRGSRPAGTSRRRRG